MNPLHIIVKFGEGIQGEAQGKLLLAWEKLGRELSGLRVELFKETMQDDSKLRRSMTLVQRNSL